MAVGPETLRELEPDAGEASETEERSPAPRRRIRSGPSGEVGLLSCGVPLPDRVPAGGEAYSVSLPSFENGDVNVTPPAPSRDVDRCPGPWSGLTGGVFPRESGRPPVVVRASSPSSDDQAIPSGDPLRDRDVPPSFSVAPPSDADADEPCEFESAAVRGWRNRLLASARPAAVRAECSE